MRRITRFVAFDEELFDTEEECRAYEAKHVEARLIGLTAERIAAALSRADPDLADAIEAIAGRIARTRREAGDLRRVRKPVEASAPLAAPPEAGPPDEELGARYRGGRDFAAGKPGMVPDDLRDDPVASDDYLAGWDAASVASAKARDIAASAKESLA